MGVVIKWVNKISKETGYVESVNTKEKHFVNTFDKNKAYEYPNAGLAKIAIGRLTAIGEAEANDFELENV